MATMRPMVWRLAENRVWELHRPRVLAILNLTPDSFSDGGKLSTESAAVARAAECLKQGADGLDVGGESTRPGSTRVTESEQVRRVVPAIRAIRRELGDGFAITIDTSRAAVALAALDAGADAINDVSAGLDDEVMLGAAARRGCGIVLMHRRVEPARDVFSHQHGAAPVYSGGVVGFVRGFLAERARLAIEAGVRPGSIVVDPGLGFGKSVEQNLELIEHTRRLCELGYPVMSGISRKSFVAAWASIDPARPAHERAEATVRLSLRHRDRGAAIFRVHDVEAHTRALGLSKPEAP